MPPEIPHREESIAGYTNIFMHTDRFWLPINPVPVFKDLEDRPFTTLARLLHTEWHERRAGWATVSQSIFTLLLQYLKRWRQEPECHPAVRTLQASIVEHFSDHEFEPASVMRKLPLEENHLRRVFRQTLGLPPQQYLLQLRLEEAARLLRVGGFSIKEVSALAGFRDSYYFSRCFRQRFGCPPSHFTAH
jgi:AraC family L-rhamnose operon regulatory protein RhaS